MPSQSFSGAEEALGAYASPRREPVSALRANIVLDPPHRSARPRLGGGVVHAGEGGIVQ